MEKMNDVLFDNTQGQFKFSIDYTYGENQLKLEIIDPRLVAVQIGSVADIYLIADEDLLTETWGGEACNKNEIHNMNQIIRLTKTTLIKHTPSGDFIYYTNLDLHTEKTLHLQNYVLISYDTLSKFNMDTIIKK